MTTYEVKITNKETGLIQVLRGLTHKEMLMWCNTLRDYGFLDYSVYMVCKSEMKVKVNQ